ncbi:hypothetical protein H257_02667 [Aphanomyces astaci]|uniref:Uncharacterized protein n=1 Tax=Aphanomyces astaci TaxID=112090 RepID=W4H4P7_APHAT|nr:hypothetical protein H257_02667 [Aphanomyces astaci]ETV86239.1 hypothetical protein H257_02667 [Aphanomyces astaci]|eukprot:XP_009824711.1 hypothetical protein H257_02667 [Aphanomyces astaci]
MSLELVKCLQTCATLISCLDTCVAHNMPCDTWWLLLLVSAIAFHDVIASPSPMDPSSPSQKVHRALGWISGTYSIGRDAATSTFRLSLVDGYVKAVAPEKKNVKQSRQSWRVFRAHEADDRNMLQHVVEGKCLKAWTHKWLRAPIVHAFGCAANESHQHWVMEPSYIGHTRIQPQNMSNLCLTVAPPNRTSGTPLFSDPTLEPCAKGRQDQLYYFYP